MDWCDFASTSLKMILEEENLFFHFPVFMKQILKLFLSHCCFTFLIVCMLFFELLIKLLFGDTFFLGIQQSFQILNLLFELWDWIRIGLVKINRLYFHGDMAGSLGKLKCVYSFINVLWRRWNVSDNESVCIDGQRLLKQSSNFGLPECCNFGIFTAWKSINDFTQRCQGKVDIFELLQVVFFYILSFMNFLAACQIA